MASIGEAGSDQFNLNNLIKYLDVITKMLTLLCKYRLHQTECETGAIIVKIAIYVKYLRCRSL